jgi:hypothetical protein
MLSRPCRNEWRLLKDRFDALAHDQDVREDSIQTILDDVIRRRFGDWIARAASHEG